jgi:hypothetical protein
LKWQHILLVIYCIFAFIPSTTAVGSAAVNSPVSYAATGLVGAVATAATAAHAAMPSEDQAPPPKKQRSYDRKLLCRLLGMSRKKVTAMMSQDSLIQAITTFFKYQDQTDHLERSVRSHGHGPHCKSSNTSPGIFWRIIQVVGRITTTRLGLFHYPPPKTTSHVDSDGNGTCFTFRILAANVNRAIRMKFRDIFHGVFDLMPFCQDIGYNVSKAYYSNRDEEQKKKFVQGHVRVLVSFFLGQMSIGRLNCRCFISGSQGCLHWHQIVRDAAIAVNIIAGHYGKAHYKVTCPTFDSDDKLNEFDLSSNEELPSLESRSVCHPAAFAYRLSEKMGVRFDKALTYVLAEILSPLRKRLTLFTRRALYCEMAEMDGHAVRAGYGNNEDEPLWSKVGGEYINMPQSYQDAVTEGRSILGRMGYAAVIANIMEAHDCSEEEARTIFGQLGGVESARADHRGIAGLHPSKRLKRDRTSMADRGRQSNRYMTTGVTKGGRTKEDVNAGKGRGGSENLGRQNIDRPIMLLQLVSSTADPNAPLVKKYTRSQNEIADVLVANKFTNSISGIMPRIKEWKDAANNSDDKSHPFTTKKQGLRSDSAPRATDRWILSLHESEDLVKAFAPEATKVTTDDRKVSESYREEKNQRDIGKHLCELADTVDRSK